MKLIYVGKNEEGEDLFMGSDKEWKKYDKLFDPQDDESRPKIEKVIESLERIEVLLS